MTAPTTPTPTAAISVRQASLDDLDQLAPLFDSYRQFYRGKPDLAGARAFLQARLERGQSVLLLAFDCARAIGLAQLYPSFSSLSMGATFILNDLFVSEAGRQRGAGAALIGAAVAHARTTGAIGLSLSTARDNHTAQSLYRAMGWEQDHQFIEFSLSLTTS